jgi:hypothetical protein
LLVRTGATLVVVLQSFTRQGILLNAMIDVWIKTLEPEFILVLTKITIGTIHQDIFVVDVIDVALGCFFDVFAL